jgi:general secretion pathway protein B
MSYILEALRRAESERERKRGGVPGLHARPVPMPSSDELGERRGNPWAWVAGALTVGVLLLILWRWWSVEPLVDESMLARAPVGGNVAQGSADAPAAASAAPATPAPAPAEPAPQAAPAPSPAPAPKAAASGAAPDKPPRSSKPATPPRSTAADAATPRKPAPPQGSAQGATPVAPAPATQAAALAAPAPERLRSLADLPDDVRRSVPQLAFGGSVYSDTPAQRMVIFNGQVMREGDAVTEELQIEQIRPRSAVMRVRGQRFEMPF